MGVFDVGQVRAMVQQVINIGANKEFQADTMQEFDLAIEGNSMKEGEAWLLNAAKFFHHEPTYFSVPSVCKVSRDGHSMLMDYKENAENLIDAFPNDKPIETELGKRLETIDGLLKLYVHGLVIGSIVHADLHPGNVLLTREGGHEWKPGFTLVDWGIACQVPRKERCTVLELLQASVGLCKCDLKSSFGKLGFKVKGKDEESLPDEAWSSLSKLFDPVKQVDGLDLRPVLEAMNLVNWPSWVTLWQKATGSLAASLKHLHAKQDHLRASMRTILEKVGKEHCLPSCSA